MPTIVDITYVGNDASSISISPVVGSSNLWALTVDRIVRDELDANSILEIHDPADDDALLQYLEIHTSCSKPLNVGDVFGSLTLKEFVPDKK